MGIEDHEFVPDHTQVRRPATPEGERARRYLTDPQFHYLVNRLRNGIAGGVFTPTDVQEALLVVEALEQQRKQRVAAGLEPDVQQVLGRSPIQDVRDHLAAFEQRTDSGDTAGDIVRGK